MIGFNHLGKLGQLGNQMFQFASLKGIAKMNKTEYSIPYHQEVMIDNLGNKLRIELFDAFNMDNCNLGFVNTNNYVIESKFEFDESFFDLDLDNSISLVGFFQSEKYFKHIEEEIRNDFTFSERIIEECSSILNSFDDPISLHIRRGDFLINSENHANLSISYYKESLRKFNNNRQVIIFSDDPNWCKKQELFKDDRFLISEGNSSYHDLYLMSKCSDFIIANSTFSWWGAWLANRGKVISPSIWFGPNNLDKNTKDLYCSHWIII